MHLIATNLPVRMFFAFSTSEKVPSPFLLASLYAERIKGENSGRTMHLVVWQRFEIGDLKVLHLILF
jgi:hypothetical protein